MHGCIRGRRNDCSPLVAGAALSLGLSLDEWRRSSPRRPYDIGFSSKQITQAYVFSSGLSVRGAVGRLASLEGPDVCKREGSLPCLKKHESPRLQPPARTREINRIIKYECNQDSPVTRGIEFTRSIALGGGWFGSGARSANVAISTAITPKAAPRGVVESARQLLMVLLLPMA
jgi:hypothetical protein